MIRQHLLALSDAYPSLQLRTDNFTHNNGYSVNLLKAGGTISTVYRQVAYDIPIIIWLMECYPRFPPLVFVEPKSDMIINRQNPCVNPDGAVSILYLKNWASTESNLVELAQNLSDSFDAEPPLHSKHDYDFDYNSSMDSMVLDRGAAADTILRWKDYHQTSPDDDNSNSSSSSSIISSNCCNTAASSSSSSSDEGKEREILAENLHRDLVELSKRKEAEIEGLFNAQTVLRQQEGKLGKLLVENVDEKERLEQELMLVLLNTEVLDGWLKENEEKLGNLDVKQDEDVDVVDVDQALEPCDRLSKQILHCSASDLAIEDAMYALDKSLHEGAIPFDQYLKYIRSLSREQFFHRATASKVRDVQMQVQVFKHGL